MELKQKTCQIPNQAAKVQKSFQLSVISQQFFKPKSVIKIYVRTEFILALQSPNDRFRFKYVVTT